MKSQLSNGNLWGENDFIELKRKSKNNGEIDQIITIKEIGKEFAENEWKNITNQKISGIYKIINKVNGKYYVGSSNDIIGIGGRWREHLNALNRNYHHNRYLQRSWNKYGPTNFRFVIVEIIPEFKLVIIEQRYLNIAKQEQNKCYNSKFISERGGGQFSNEVRKRLSESKKGSKNPNWKKKFSKDHKEKMRIAHQGKSYITTKYQFYNIFTNEIFVGSKFELYTKFGLNRTCIFDVVRGRQNHTKGWALQK